LQFSFDFHDIFLRKSQTSQQRSHVFKAGGVQSGTHKAHAPKYTRFPL